jgi:hypothetical protein
MATGPLTQISDLVIPEIFASYIQQLTEQKARVVQSGAMELNGMFSGLLAGGGKTFNIPSQRDLDNDDENVSSDDVADSIAWTQLSGTAVGGNYPTLNDSIPAKTQADTEVGVRLSRNMSWSSADLAAALAGKDPLDGIMQRTGFYWLRRLQAAFIATMNGVIGDNTANDSADYTNNVSGASFVDGVTNFSAEAFLDASVTMGDSMEGLTMVMVHSVVYNRMQKNNLIDFIPDSEGRVSIPTFLGREVIVDDGLPVTSNVYDTWLFGRGAVQFGAGSPDVPVEVERKPSAGNGGGQEILYNRVEWLLHPTGHAYVGTAPKGGPGNSNASNNLAAAGSWNRVFPERKQIKFARLVTREA